MISSAVGMVGGKMSAMSLGFAFWLLAANLASVDAVGLAAAATSTVMLIVMIAGSGIASASVVTGPTYRFGLAHLVATALTAVALLSVVFSVAALVFARTALDELGVVGENLIFATIFVIMCVLGSFGVVLDQLSMADRRGNEILVRNVANGLVTIAPLGLLAVGLVEGSGRFLFSAWVLGSASAIVVGFDQLRRRLTSESLRPRLDRTALSALRRPGIGNQLMTSAERAPGLMLPIVVTEVLSPAENAFWYATWMMAWGAAAIPMSMSTALFAEVCLDPETRRDRAVHAVRSSLMLSLPVAIGVAAAAPLLLSLLGERYSSAGAMPLRLLIVGVIPLSFIFSYHAVARAITRLTEAILAALLAGIVGITSAGFAGAEYGLTGMAAAWIGVQAVAGLWALYRLHVLTSTPISTSTDLAERIRLPS